MVAKLSKFEPVLVTGKVSLFAKQIGQFRLKWPFFFYLVSIFA